MEKRLFCLALSSKTGVDYVMDIPPPNSFQSCAAVEQAHRKQAEAALAVAEARIAALEQELTEAGAQAHRSQRQLTALVENLRIGLLLVDQEEEIRLVNQHFREMFGLATDAKEANVYPPIPPDTVRIAGAFQDPAASDERVQAMHRAGQTRLGEEFRLANGRVVALDYLVLDHARAGRLICYRDVTEQHQQAAALRAWSLIPEQNPNPILRLAATGETLYANPAAQALLRTLAAAEEAALRQRLLGMVHTALRAPAGRHPQEVAAGEQHYLLTVAAMPDEAPHATLYLTNVTEQQQAKQALAEQQLFYETILAEVPSSVVAFDTGHRYVFLNPTVEPDPAMRQQLLGKTNAEACRLRNRPAAVAEQRQRAFEEVIRQRREIIWEESVPDGDRPRYWLRRFRPIMGADGAIRLVIGSGLDITERKQIEEQAARQREFYEVILNLLPVDVAVFDAEHRFLFVNPAAISDPRVREKVIGMSNVEYGAYRQRPATLAEQREVHFRQAARTRADVMWEETIPLATGGPKRMLRHLRPVLNPDGTLRMMVGSGIDISARYAAEENQRRTESRLREQEAFIRLIVDTLPSAVYVQNAAGEVVFQNAAFDAMVAHSQYNLAYEQRSASTQLQGEQLRSWRQEALAARKALAREIAVTMDSGEICYLQVHMRPLAHAPTSEVVVVCTDVTALKKAQQEAEDNAQAKESFLARMSHEIRTPLNGVLGMTALLEKTSLTTQQQEYLATMQRAGQHLLTLVNDILDMAKIMGDHLQLDQAAFDLDVLLQGASQTVAPLAEQKRLQLTVAALPLTPMPRLLGDAYRLHQVLLNLLSNAVKFTAHGSVRLGVALLADTPQDLTLRFWVADTGMGIAPEQQAHIFDAFSQANAETSRRFGGTGLGLTISEQLVRQMGGTLLLSSLPDQGTTFSFALTLPREAEDSPESQPAAQAAPSYPELYGVRVLLAEDNLVNQWLATVMLEHWGVLVYAVGNGTDALPQLRQNDYDAAILDIQMPGLSGVEVTKAIRQYPDSRRANVPIIALTANAFEADQASYLAAGMNACLTKPFEEADLCQLLVRLIGSRSAPEAG